jgi:hypothetical protein
LTLASAEELQLWQGLDTETPFLKLGDKIYEGRFEYTVGTHLFFEQGRIVLTEIRTFAQESKCSKSTVTAPPGQAPKYCGRTTKKIVFHPIHLVPKDSSDP